MSSAEKEWEKFGRTNPYYAVYMLDKFKVENIDSSAREQFFQSGEDYVQRIWQDIERYFIADFRPNAAVDFGCGVARLTLPIATRSRKVTAVDISENMIREGRANAASYDIGNVDFVKDSSNLSSFTGGFDFIHSFIVFQHIKPKIGEVIFRKLIKTLLPGGIGVIHFTYSNKHYSSKQKFRTKLYRDFKSVYKLRNIVLRRVDEQFMPIYYYDLNKLFLILQENGCHNCHVRFSFHGMEGALLFFQKKDEQLY